MEKSFLEVKAVADTLPIGLYAKRRIETVLEDNIQESYYVPMEDKIVISYPQVAAGLKKMSEEEDIETSVRTMLYHEVSHGILTPKDMEVTDILNIFEDERIETLLSNYYYNVDFKRNVFLVNDYNGADPQNAMDEFYQTVRFRKGEQRWLDRVNELILCYSEMTAGNYQGWGWYSNNDGKSVSLNRYYEDVYNLYNEIAAKWGEPEKNHYQDRENARRGTEIHIGITNPNGNPGNGDQKVEAQSSDGEADQNQGKNGDGENKANVQAMVDAAKKESQQIGEETFGVGHANILADKVIETYYDSKLYDTLSIIIDSFNKKNTKGNSINAYSGVFNPRLVARDDYRYFQHKTSINGNNTYGTLHLNLFLDDSGSMSGNEQVVNKLIYALLCIEKRNTNFTFDVITCADRIEIADKKKGFVARGGTYLSNAIIPLYRKVQKPNTYNYNLVLFDGQADVDSYLGNTTFKVFDNNNCTIISDRSNERHLRRLSSAKIIYSYNYTDELFKNVYKTLEGAFR